MASILLLEDDFKLASELKTFLDNQGFTCDTVYDGLIFFRQLSIRRYDLYLLDINVPSMNGFDVCSRIRETDRRTPVLMLTAYSAIEDKVNALGYGADDYLVKPFHFDELLARIRALLRRSVVEQLEENVVYRVADLTVNASEMSVERAGKAVTLTPKEYKLLELLAASKGRIVPKSVIAEKVWDINFETGTNTIEVYINFLRNKIDKGFENPLIHTKPGYGYFLKQL